jgi:type VI secretion system secreted protein VgrG
MKDYDFKNPGLDLRARAESVDAGARATAGGALEIYAHQSDYEDTDVRKDVAKMRLRQLRAREQVGSGASTSRRFAAGHRFRLDEHDIERLNREYVITDVRHRGQIPEVAHGPDHKDAGLVYENEFECLKKCGAMTSCADCR